MQTKILSKKEVEDIHTAVVLAHEIRAHATMAAGVSHVCNIGKERFLEECSQCWDAIAASVQVQLDEAIGDKGENV